VEEESVDAPVPAASARAEEAVGGPCLASLPSSRRGRRTLDPARICSHRGQRLEEKVAGRDEGGGVGCGGLEVAGRMNKEAARW
jgi:hypothetical protein